MVYDGGELIVSWGRLGYIVNRPLIPHHKYNPLTCIEQLDHVVINCCYRLLRTLMRTEDSLDRSGMVAISKEKRQPKICYELIRQVSGCEIIIVGRSRLWPRRFRGITRSPPLLTSKWALTMGALITMPDVYYFLVLRDCKDRQDDSITDLMMSHMKHARHVWHMNPMKRMATFDLVPEWYLCV